MSYSDRLIEREKDEIVSMLSWRGPMTREQIERRFRAGTWKPRRVAKALQVAQQQGLIKRSGLRRWEVVVADEAGYGREQATG